MCVETVGAGECTTHFCPRGPGTSLTVTCIKSECPAQARIGREGGGCIKSECPAQARIGREGGGVK